MRSGIAVAVAGFVALAGGCASPARYVEQQRDSGVVAIPTNQGIFGKYNEREAMKLIQEHVGPNYEIVNRGEVVVGQSTTNNQQVNTEQVANRRNPNLPNERQVATSTTTTQDLKEYRIAYRRKAVMGRPDQPFGGAPPSGVMQTGATQPQGSGGLAPGVMPSVLPGGGVGGPTSYFAPGSRPGAGGACSS
jgi:hypothetical protein